jgi:hypothetical protein
MLRRRLRPWNGVVPARLDWFFGRGLEPLHSDVIEINDGAGAPISDHAAIMVDIAI